MAMGKNDRSIAALLRRRNGAVSVLFAGMAIPMIIATGLAIDYSFYAEAQSELALAADASALHSVRVAEAEFQAGATSAASITAGNTAAVQWFNSQLGTINTATTPLTTINAQQMQFNSSNGTFTNTVAYSGYVPTHVASLILGISKWPVSGTASATIAANAYSEFYILFDNSSSMNIGASNADVEAINSLTICAPTATASQASKPLIGTYSWNYPSNTTSTSAPQYGFGVYAKNNVTCPTNTIWALQTVPTAATPGPTATAATGSAGANGCYSNFTGGSALCPYPQTISNSLLTATETAPNQAGISKNIQSNGFCPTGTGVEEQAVTETNCAGQKETPLGPRTDSVSGTTAYDPQAPCGFACHTGSPNSDGSYNDYWQMVVNFNALHSTTPITLRFDVVKAAAEQVMSTLISKKTITNQFAVGVSTFTETLNPIYPSSSSFVEADTNLTAAQSAIVGITTPVVNDAANTDFIDSITTLAGDVTNAGNGATTTTRTKNLFIITDGLEDDTRNGRYIGVMTSSTSETLCQQMKNKGFSVFVLYTPYYPLPNNFYLNSGPRSYVEPSYPSSNAVTQSLAACASSPQQFLVASDLTDLNTALNTFIEIALQSPARISN